MVNSELSRLISIKLDSMHNESNQVKLVKASLFDSKTNGFGIDIEENELAPISNFKALIFFSIVVKTLPKHI